MSFLRTIILIILWVGLMAGVSSAVLDNRVGAVLTVIGTFIVGWLMVGDWIRRARTPRTLPKRRLQHVYSRWEIAELRDRYDEEQRELALMTPTGPYEGDPTYIDSRGYKRDAHTGQYLYMNSTHTPNRDVFADYPVEQ